MQNFIIAILLILLVACTGDEDEVDLPSPPCTIGEFRVQDNDGVAIWQSFPNLNRGDHQIVVDIQNPFIIVEYPNIQDPDEVVVFYSDDPGGFKDSIALTYYETQVKIDGLENGVPIYVKVKTYKEGFESTESYTVAAVPGVPGPLSDVDMNITTNIRVFSFSPNAQYLIHQSHDDRVHIANIESGENRSLDIQGFLGSWDQASSKIVTTQQVDDSVNNRIVDADFVIYDIDEDRLDTILTLDQTRWAFYQPFFGMNDNEILYQTNATTQDQKYSDLWTLDLSSQEITKLFSFEDELLYTFIYPQSVANGQLVFAGTMDDGLHQSVFFFDIDSKNLVTLLTDTYDIENPRLSPDASKIIFASRRSGTTQLWMYDRETAEYDQLTDGTMSDLLLRSFEWKSDDEIYVTQYDGSKNRLVVLGVDD